MATTQNILIGAQTFDISAHLYAGSGSAANAATTNGNTKLTITNESTVRNNVSVVGTGATSVTSDANGKITINSTDITYTFADGENSFTVTPSNGSAQTVEVTPSLEKSATNSFDDGIDSYFKKVVSSIVPVQAGSGTPSPTNVRAISGFTECTVTDTNGTDTNTATISFGSAGTVYGGEVDLTTGVLTVDRGYTTLDGTENYTTGTTSIFRYFDCLSATYPVNVWETDNLSNEFAKQGTYPYVQFDGTKRVRFCFNINDTSVTTVAELQTLLQNTPAQIVYPLATPQTYQLTPTQLRSLVGTNNLTSSTGDVTEVEYITNKTIAYVDDKVEDSTFTFTLTNVPTSLLDTADTDITSYSDKTPSEIKAAYLTGKTICCKIIINSTVTDAYLLYPCHKYDYTYTQYGWVYDYLVFGNLDYGPYSFRKMSINVDFAVGAIKSIMWRTLYATSNTPGVIYVGNGLAVDNGTVSVKNPTEYTAVTTESQAWNYTYYVSSNYQSMRIGLSSDISNPWPQNMKKHLYCQIYDSNDLCLMCELIIPIGGRISGDLTDIRCICSGGFSCDYGAITKVDSVYFLLDTTKIKRGSDTLAQLMNDVSPDVSFIIYVD